MPPGGMGGRGGSGSYQGCRCGVEVESDVKVDSRPPSITICSYSTQVLADPKRQRNPAAKARALPRNKPAANNRKVTFGDG